MCDLITFIDFCKHVLILNLVQQHISKKSWQEQQKSGKGGGCACKNTCLKHFTGEQVYQEQVIVSWLDMKKASWVVLTGNNGATFTRNIFIKLLSVNTGHLHMAVLCLYLGIRALSHQPYLVRLNRTWVLFLIWCSLFVQVWTQQLYLGAHQKRTKQVDRALVEEMVSVHFQTDSGAVCFWWERDPTSVRANCRKHYASLD